MILNLAGRTPRIAASAYIAPSADIIGSVEVGENSSVWFQCVLRGDIEPVRVGANSNIQDGTIMHTVMGAPVSVGDWVTVGHRVILHGCTVENHCLIGMGAVLLNHVLVGEGSIVAGGAVVTENTVIPPRSLYMGVPAKLRRELGEKEQEFIRMHATNYLQYKADYLARQAQSPAAALGEPEKPQGS
ncbi:MAG: gamma carbonic anhydrase family protein [Terriglobia bacterium]|jgi:carbonic anhydrase/acetyltransferase-like protein (isoleucine patch superfamily)